MIRRRFPYSDGSLRENFEFDWRRWNNLRYSVELILANCGLLKFLQQHLNKQVMTEKARISIERNVESYLLML